MYDMHRFLYHTFDEMLVRQICNAAVIFAVFTDKFYIKLK